MSSDWQPELDSDDDAPIRSGRRRRVLRAVVIVALCAMVLPVVLSAYGVALKTAGQVCRLTADAYDTSADGFRVEFSFTGPGGPGWLCWAELSGGDRIIANLGVMPGAVPPAVRGRAT